jgi:hypothetical protein
LDEKILNEKEKVSRTNELVAIIKLFSTKLEEIVQKNLFPVIMTNFLSFFYTNKQYVPSDDITLFEYDRLDLSPKFGYLINVTEK